MNRIIFFLWLGCTTCFTACTYDKEPLVVTPKENGYPDNIAQILVSKCATEGCHNTQSKAGAGGLDFSTWDNMFLGGRNGNSVIPYSVDHSFMLNFVNTDANFTNPYNPIDTIKPIAPVMPYNGTPLSHDEVLTLVNWIHNGAPDKKGFVKFSDNSLRRKFYIPNQGCDEVAVFDADSRVIMRYIKVGVDDNVIESPHQVRVSPDGNYWYVVFYNGHVIQKFSTYDDSYIGAIEIGSHQWNTISFTPDSKKAYICDPGVPGPGIIQVVDLETMAATIQTSQGNTHGSYVTAAGYLYVTNQSDNLVYRVPVADVGFNWDTEPLFVTTPSITLQPHEIVFTPDENYYFVTCQHSNEVREMKVNYSGQDSLVAIYNVGDKPQEMSISSSTPYLYVTCMEDSSVSGQRGSVYIINYQSHSISSHVYSGWQPHGIAVDDHNQVVYVANRNVNGGVAPHHSSSCGGKNGYVSILDMNTNQLLEIHNPDGSSYIYKNELLADPYFISVRK
jgi:DNA-binding beta-propeller fold protein YncE